MFDKIQLDAEKRHKFKAYIGLNSSWFHYYSHYKSAIDYIVGGIENHLPVNTVAPSLLFLVRHCLELGFKANILKLETVNLKVPRLVLKGGKSHNLEYLYNTLAAHLRHIQESNFMTPEFQDTVENYLAISEKLKDILHELDRSSYSFRYPEDTNGTMNFKSDAEVNIADILEVFYSLQPFLIFCEGIFDELGILDSSK